MISIAMVGRGPTDPADHLAPAGLAGRLLSPATRAAFAAPFLKQASPAAITVPDAIPACGRQSLDELAYSD